MAALCQVDNYQACEGQEAEVDKPAGLGRSPGPRSGRSFGRGASRAAPCDSLVLGLHGSLLALWALQPSQGSGRTVLANAPGAVTTQLAAIAAVHPH